MSLAASVPEKGPVKEATDHALKYEYFSHVSPTVSLLEIWLGCLIKNNKWKIFLLPYAAFTCVLCGTF